MITFRERKISAHHNYLVNNLLTTGFLVGNPDSKDGFYFLADRVLPGQGTALISARLFDEKGSLLVDFTRNQIVDNPSGCALQSIPGGFRMLRSSGDVLLELRTQSFANGYLTRIKTKSFDEKCTLRLEPLGESIEVHGKVKLNLETPLNLIPDRS